MPKRRLIPEKYRSPMQPDLHSVARVLFFHQLMSQKTDKGPNT